VIITPESNLIEKKVKEANFRAKFDAAIISIKRGAKNLSKIGEVRLEAGDRLILAVGKDFKSRDNLDKNFYILSGLETTKRLSQKSSLLLVGTFLGVILLAGLGVISLIKGLFAFLGALVLLKMTNLGELKRRFPYDIFLIVGSSLAISKVILDCGLAGDLADVVNGSFGSFGVYGSFIGIYLLTLLLTEIITNNAAAALSFPIAFAIATALGVSPYPFIFAVAFGASASFIFPYGYQTNLMVSSLGNYSLKDFMRVGWVVSLSYSVSALVAIPIFFPF